MRSFPLLMTAVFFCLFAKADSPGKREMKPCKVSFQNIKQWNNYTFHYSFHYGDAAGLLQADTSLVIPGSGGAPDGFAFWAIHNKTGKSTDTVTFYNYYDPDKVIILTGFKGDSIRYSNAELSNANEIVTSTNTDSIANKTLVEEAASVKRNHYYKIAAYSGAALIALAALTWFFLKKRKKQTL